MDSLEYDCDRNPIAVSLQILPTGTDGERICLLSAAIEGVALVTLSAKLADLLENQTIQSLLDDLYRKVSEVRAADLEKERQKIVENLSKPQDKRKRGIPNGQLSLEINLPSKNNCRF